MRIDHRVRYLKVGSLVLGGLIALFGSGVAQEKDKAERSTPIPLDSMYVTSEQEDLKHVFFGDARFSRLTLGTLFENSKLVGTSNIFLVRGAEIKDAVQATTVAYNRGFGARDPVWDDPLQNNEQLWVVAFFGVSGSGPLEWIVKGVERADNRVRVSFSQLGSHTQDRFPYFLWAPLGRLEAGEYTLDLYDATEKIVVLSRNIKVAR